METNVYQTVDLSFLLVNKRLAVLSIEGTGRIPPSK